MSDDSDHIGGAPVVLALENVFYQFAPLNVRVGDIFVTPHGLHYVPYAEFLSHGGAGVGAASLLGGLAGGIAASIGEKDRRNAALQHAAKQRRIQWGMNLAERLRRNNNVLTIPRRNVANLRVHETLSFTDGEKTFEFGVPELAKYSTALSGWLDGSVVEARPHCIVSSKHTAPQLVLEALVAGETARMPAGELEAVALDNDYMTRLWGLFEYLRAKDQRAVVATVDRLGGAFRDSVVSLRHASVTSGKKALAFGLGALVLGGLMVARLAQPFLEGRSKEPSSFLEVILFIAVAPTLFAGFAGLWTWFKSTRY